jgi:tetratricopeptide (TPR) repeat protein
MVIIKKLARDGSVFFLAGLLGGCTPAGPRALLDGKALIEQGKYPEAMEKLRTATSLLGTNAQAWNYFGLACQYEGHSRDAEAAYQKALACDHDLTEAHYNLGCLWLAQSKIEPAKAEFIACTLRRGNDPAGFIKLGEAQSRAAMNEAGVAARAREWAAAEKSFNEALRLQPQQSGALNGLGVVRLERGHTAEAAQLFNSALKQQPGYAPALLNLAICEQQYLRDPQSALQKYREYLALKPQPENAEAVKTLVHQLEQSLNPPPRPATTNASIPSNAAIGAARPLATNTSHAANTQSLVADHSSSPPQPRSNAPTLQRSNAPSTPPEVVNLAPSEPALHAAQDVPPAQDAANSAASQTVASADPKSSPKRGILKSLNPLNLFQSERKVSSADSTAAQGGSQSAASSGSRYSYQSPSKPASGNRAAAERAFAQGVEAQKSHHLAEALQSYRLATQADPSYFEAHYNLALAATEAGNSSQALAAYETGLAIRPESLDARYNFALVLKQAGYLQDAVNELERVLKSFPNETRAHLALGNIYAQQLRQPAQARQHYLKVVQADPGNPQADAIRYWLASHPL